MKNFTKRIATALLTGLMVMTMAIGSISINASAAWTWRKGGFSGGTAWSTWQYIKPQVKAGRWGYSPKYSNATVYFYSYKGNGKAATGNTMYVQVYHNRYGNCVYDYSIRNTGSIKLSYRTSAWDRADWAQLHNEYKIHIRRRASWIDETWWAMKVDGNRAFWV